MVETDSESSSKPSLSESSQQNTDTNGGRENVAEKCNLDSQVRNSDCSAKFSMKSSVSLKSASVSEQSDFFELRLNQIQDSKNEINPQSEDYIES